MMIKFPKKPICEECGKEEATSFSFIKKNIGVGMHGDWKFCCKCTEQIEHYYIPIEEFFSSSSKVVHWLAHMHEKTWMNWKNFMDMMSRFRAATGS